jgi:hypothetical protein
MGKKELQRKFDSLRSSIKPIDKAEPKPSSISGKNWLASDERLASKAKAQGVEITSGRQRKAVESQAKGSSKKMQATKKTTKPPVEVVEDDETDDAEIFRSTNFVAADFGGQKRTLVLVKPSQCEFSDDARLNRNREGWDTKKLTALKGSVQRAGYTTPCVGWMKGKKIIIGRGSQRLKVGQELEAEGYEDLRLPVVFRPEPKTDADFRDILLDTLEDNTYRYADDWRTRVQSFTVLKDNFGMSDVQIGKATGFSHTVVNQHLKAVDVAEKLPAIAKALQEETIMPREAALLTTAQYRQGGTKDGELDLEAVKQGFEDALTAANEQGSAIIRKQHLPPSPNASSRGGQGGQTGLGMPWLKLIQEAASIRETKPDPDVDVPRDILLFISLFKGQVKQPAMLARLHKQGDESFDWLIELQQWIVSKDKAAAKRKSDAAAKKAAKEAEAEEPQAPKASKKAAPAPKPATPQQKAAAPKRRPVMVDADIEE